MVWSETAAGRYAVDMGWTQNPPIARLWGFDPLPAPINSFVINDLLEHSLTILAAVRLIHRSANQEFPVFMGLGHQFSRSPVFVD